MSKNRGKPGKDQANRVLSRNQDRGDPEDRCKSLECVKQQHCYPHGPTTGPHHVGGADITASLSANVPAADEPGKETKGDCANEIASKNTQPRHGNSAGSDQSVDSL